MGVELRFPNITATNTEGQVAQMQSYMHQLVQQLNWALSSVNSAAQGDTSNIVLNGGKNGGKTELSPKEAEDTFNSIKSLIIKSADIVKAYEDTMKETFNGSYVAQSDFGDLVRDTKLTIETDSRSISEFYSNTQEITNRIDSDVALIKDINAYIRRGELEEGVIGIEIGQTTTYDKKDENGNTVTDEDGNPVKASKFERCARFTASRLSFFDSNDFEVAYIGQENGVGCLYIVGRAAFLGDIQMGKYTVDTSDGLAFGWIE